MGCLKQRQNRSTSWAISDITLLLEFLFRAPCHAGMAARMSGLLELVCPYRERAKGQEVQSCRLQCLHALSYHHPLWMCLLPFCLYRARTVGRCKNRDRVAK